MHRRHAVATLILVLTLFAGACSDDDGAADATTTTTTDPVTTTEPDDEPQTTTSTTEVDEPTATTADEREPGELCEPGTPDCVEDAWYDGEHRYIVGHDECIDELGHIDGACEDLDQDGYAGYPDSQ